jgi:hypothetical protein
MGTIGGPFLFVRTYAMQIQERALTKDYQPMARISCSKQLTIHIVQGKFHFDEAVEAVKEFYEVKPTTDVLWDLREGTWQGLSDENIMSIVSFVAQHAHVREGGRTAMVVPANIDYGIARAFQSYTADLSFETGVFRNMDEAIKWLAES